MYIIVGLKNNVEWDMGGSYDVPVGRIIATFDYLPYAQQYLKDNSKSLYSKYQQVILEDLSNIPLNPRIFNA